jgi:glucokinase
MAYLVGDLGGTHVRLRLVERAAVGWRCLHEAEGRARDCAGPVEALSAFLAAGPRSAVEGACLAVAGPLREGACTMTNLGWRLDAAALARRFDLRFVDLINDFHAVALGLPHVPAASLRCVRAGIEGDGLRLAIGPGTGLGAVLFDARGQVLPTEAGHVAFAPLDAEQDALLAFLRKTHRRVTYEHVVSGPALVSLWRFQRERAGLDAIANVDPASVSAAAANGDPQARAAIALSLSVLGAFAGDLVLAALATGGVTLVGGLLSRLPECGGFEAFGRAFADKAGMAPVVANVPVHLAATGEVGLLGAQAWIAKRAG